MIMLGKAPVLDGYNLWSHLDIREIKIILKDSTSKQSEN